MNQVPHRNDAGPSNAGPADSPQGSFPSVPSSLTPLPESPSVPSVPSLPSVEENNPSGREQPEGEADQPVQPQPQAGPSGAANPQPAAPGDLKEVPSVQEHTQEPK